MQLAATSGFTSPSYLTLIHGCQFIARCVTLVCRFPIQTSRTLSTIWGSRHTKCKHSASETVSVSSANQVKAPNWDPLERKKSRLPIRVRTATSTRIGTNSTHAFQKFYLRTETDSASETLCYSLLFGILGTLIHITPWSIVFVEKLIVPHLLNKFPKFQGPRKFINVFSKARHLFLAIPSPLILFFTNPF